MPNTALNRTTQVLLTNKSGGNLNYGDVVVLDNTNSNGFTTTTTSGLSTRQIGVILEPNGIANNASGMVATGGWAPRCNLNTSAAVGQFVKSHTVAGQGTPHASPQQEGDFAVALTASATPPVCLFGSPNGPTSGTGTVTNTGTLTANKAIIGNGSADVTVSAASGVAHLVSGTLTGSNVLLASEVTGVLPGTQGGGWVLVEQHTASSSASLDFTTGITSTYDVYEIQFVNVIPANTANAVLVLLSTNGGSTWDTTAIYDNMQNYAFGTTVGALANVNQANWSLATVISNSANYGLNGTLWLSAPLSTAVYTGLRGEFHYLDSTVGNIINRSSSWYKSTTAVNAFQVKFNSGNIASGIIRVYGLSK